MAGPKAGRLGGNSATTDPPPTLTFIIDTPEPLPLARLAEYLTALAKLLGHEDSVHLIEVRQDEPT
jgi:hypothetical protein